MEYRQTAELHSQWAPLLVMGQLALGVGCTDAQLATMIPSDASTTAIADAIGADPLGNMADGKLPDTGSDASRQALPHWDGRPITCGSIKCTGLTFAKDLYAPPPCCPEGPDASVCGRAPGYTEGSARCQPLAYPGIDVDTSVCPEVHEHVESQGLELSWGGCCRKDGICGARDLSQGTGCTFVDLAPEENPPRTCNYGALARDGGDGGAFHDADARDVVMDAGSE